MKNFFKVLILVIVFLFYNTFVKAEEMVQKVKAITTITNEEGSNLTGAILQIIDSNGEVVDEWESNENSHETMLQDGLYTLREKKAPKGYDLANDQNFEVIVELDNISAGADYSKVPCEHYGGTPMYYIEINGKKEETYCINQNWETPDENSIYDGVILKHKNIRDFTKQTIPIGLNEENPIDVIMSSEEVDVSDQSLTDQELYDKLLDIIYHRYKASNELNKKGYTYSEAEIRFITEVALKNYTNPGITERQYNVKATDKLIKALEDAGVIYKTYIQNGKEYVSYLKHNYRDYVYILDASINENIVITDYGKGSSFAQMVASHWVSKHGANKDQLARDNVKRYYELFKYLISDEDHHPNNMSLYIYSSNSVPKDLSGNDNDARYQNLLGITGFFDNVKEKIQNISIVNKYSSETIDINVEKIWNDDNNNIRPMSIIINLLANNELYTKVNLDNTTNWKYTFKELPLYHKGNLIKYTIAEDSVSNYYSKLSGDMYNGFSIVNTYYEEKKEEENPQTLDNINIYVVILLVSLFSFIITIIIYTRRLKN